MVAGIPLCQGSIQARPQLRQAGVSANDQPPFLLALRASRLGFEMPTDEPSVPMPLIAKEKQMPERWPAVLTRKDAAEYLGMSVTTFDELHSEGKLKAVRYVKRLMYRRSDLDDFILQLEEVSHRGNG